MFETIFARRGLSLDRLKTLVEVDASGSISVAAGRSPARQSQFSRQLRELSEFFGLELTEHKGKQVKLTAQGSCVAALTRQFLVGLEDFQSENQNAVVPIRIAAGDSLIQWLLVPRLARSQSAFPRVSFEVFNLQTPEITQRLGNSSVDFGILRANAKTPNVESASIGILSYVAFVPKGLKRPGRPPTLDQILKDYPLALQVTEGQFTEHVRNLANSRGIQFRPKLACQSLPQALAAVRSGTHASILPTLATSELRSGSYFTVTDKALQSLSREIALMWNPRLVAVRPTASKVLEVLQSILKF